MNLLEVFDRPSFEPILSVLVHFVWQAAAIAIVWWIGLGTIISSKPEARYRWSLLHLAFLVAAPSITLVIALGYASNRYSQTPHSSGKPVGEIAASDATGGDISPDNAAVDLPFDVRRWSAAASPFPMSSPVQADRPFDFNLVEVEQQHNAEAATPADANHHPTVSDQPGVGVDSHIAGSPQIDSPLANDAMQPAITVPTDTGPLGDDSVTDVVQPPVAWRGDIAVNGFDSDAERQSRSIDMSDRLSHSSTPSLLSIVRLAAIHKQFTDSVRPSQRFLIGGWLVGVMVLGLRLMLGGIVCFRIRRNRAALPARVQSMVDGLTQSMQFERAREMVWSSTRVGEAIALGMLRPVILIPLSWINHLPPETLRAVLAHELAHMRRHDVIVNLFQRVVETCFFFHPAVWWISNQIRFERECCCDRLAVAATENRVEYARALAEVARMRLDGVPSGLVASFLGGRKMSLLKRVRCVLNGPPRPKRRTNAFAGMVTLGVVLAMTGMTVVAQQDANRSNNQERRTRDRDDRQERVEQDRDQPDRSNRNRTDRRDGRNTDRPDATDRTDNNSRQRRTTDQRPDADQRRTTDQRVDDDRRRTSNQRYDGDQQGNSSQRTDGNRRPSNDRNPSDRNANDPFSDGNGNRSNQAADQRFSNRGYNDNQQGVNQDNPNRQSFDRYDPNASPADNRFGNQQLSGDVFDRQWPDRNVEPGPSQTRNRRGNEPWPNQQNQFDDGTRRYDPSRSDRGLNSPNNDPFSDNNFRQNPNQSDSNRGTGDAFADPDWNLNGQNSRQFSQGRNSNANRDDEVLMLLRSMHSEITQLRQEVDDLRRQVESRDRRTGRSMPADSIEPPAPDETRPNNPVRDPRQNRSRYPEAEDAQPTRPREVRPSEVSPDPFAPTPSNRRRPGVANPIRNTSPESIPQQQSNDPFLPPNAPSEVPDLARSVGPSYGAPSNPGVVPPPVADSVPGTTPVEPVEAPSLPGGTPAAPSIETPSIAPPESLPSRLEDPALAPTLPIDTLDESSLPPAPVDPVSALPGTPARPVDAPPLNASQTPARSALPGETLPPGPAVAPAVDDPTQIPALPPRAESADPSAEPIPGVVPAAPVPANVPTAGLNDTSPPPPVADPLVGAPEDTPGAGSIAAPQTDDPTADSFGSPPPPPNDSVPEPNESTENEDAPPSTSNPLIESKVVGIVETRDHELMIALDVGSDDGVKTGQNFDVLRRDSYVGRIMVVSVTANRSSARVIPEATVSAVEIDDQVTNRLLR